MCLCVSVCVGGGGLGLDTVCNIPENKLLFNYFSDFNSKLTWLFSRTAILKHSLVDMVRREV